jgi:hypothetical protein
MAPRTAVPTYTFIANYGLGTYLDQCEAMSAGEAVKAYAGGNDFAFLSGIDSESRENLKSALISCNLEAAGQLRNVWACAVPVQRDLFLLHVVLSA